MSTLDLSDVRAKPTHVLVAHFGLLRSFLPQQEMLLAAAKKVLQDENNQLGGPRETVTAPAEVLLAELQERVDKCTTLRDAIETVLNERLDTQI